jgi:uncharacterized protein YegP (UPF0339 family)
MAGKFEIYKDLHEDYCFRLRADNGKIILTNEGYKVKASVINGIKSVMKNAADLSRYEKKATESDQFIFSLKDVNGQVIGTSESYKTEEARDNGIASVMRDASVAKVDDQTI